MIESRPFMLQPTHEGLKKVADLRKRFNALVHPQNEGLTQGQMLLMGFNGLFEKLDQELSSLISTVGTLVVPQSWRKIDQVKEAKSIAAHVFHPKVKAVLDDIFLLKRLQTMTEFITLCVEMCQSFKGIGNVTIFTDEQLVKPIRQFIADFISRQFLGITTETIAYTICFLLQHLGIDVANEIEQKDIGAENKVPLDELYQKCWPLFLKRGAFTQNVLAQASSLETNLKTAWEKIQEPKKIEQNLTMLQSSVIRMQNQLTVHNLIFEEILRQHPVLLSACSFIRGKFVVELRKELTSLRTLQCKLAESREQQKSLIASAEQRLKWAAGANPDLNEILSAFECAISVRDNRLDIENRISSIILSTGGTILQHEVLKTTSNESTALDKLFLSTCEKWRAAIQYNAIKLESVTPTEENIMKLYTPECAKNPKWLLVISEKISDLIISTQKDVTEQKVDLYAMTDTVSNSIDNLSRNYSKHCKLVGEVKSLIKSMAKIEDLGLQTQQFIADYREYMEKFSVILHSAKEMSDEKIEQYLENLKYLEEHTEKIYENFMNLERNGTVKANKLVRQDGFCKGNGSKPVKQESTTKGQQRNAYAVSVWRRVRMKLEGRDPDPGKKYTTQEQVRFFPSLFKKFIAKDLQSIFYLLLLQLCSL